MIISTYLRHEVIGSSDAAAIVGKSPYKTPYDLWLEKVQMVDGEVKSNEACELGNMCEDGLVTWAQVQIGARGVQRDVTVRDEDCPFIAANLDAVLEQSDGTHANCEAKTAGLASPLQWERWGEEFTDEVPEEYIIQAHHQMYVAKLNITYLPALLAPRGRKLFIIRRDEALIQAVLHAEIEFWEKHVLKRVPPPKSAPSLDVIRRVRRVPSKTVSLATDLVTELRDATADSKRAGKREDEAKAAVLTGLSFTDEAGATAYADAGETTEGDRVEFFANKRGVRSLKLKENIHV